MYVIHAKEDARIVTVASTDDDWEIEDGLNRRGTSSTRFFTVNSPYIDELKIWRSIIGPYLAFSPK